MRSDDMKRTLVDRLSIDDRFEGRTKRIVAQYSNEDGRVRPRKGRCRPLHELNEIEEENGFNLILVRREAGAAVYRILK